MKRFSDLGDLDSQALQKILGRTKPSELVVCLCGSDESFSHKVLALIKGTGREKIAKKVAELKPYMGPRRIAVAQARMLAVHNSLATNQPFIEPHPNPNIQLNGYQKLTALLMIVEVQPALALAQRFSDRIIAALIAQWSATEALIQFHRLEVALEAKAIYSAGKLLGSGDQDGAGHALGKFYKAHHIHHVIDALRQPVNGDTLAQAKPDLTALGHTLDHFQKQIAHYHKDDFDFSQLMTLRADLSEIMTRHSQTFAVNLARVWLPSNGHRQPVSGEGQPEQVRGLSGAQLFALKVLKLDELGVEKLQRASTLTELANALCGQPAVSAHVLSRLDDNNAQFVKTKIQESTASVEDQEMSREMYLLTVLDNLIADSDLDENFIRAGLERLRQAAE